MVAAAPWTTRDGKRYGKVYRVSAVPVADDVLDSQRAIVSLDEVAKRIGLSTSRVRQLVRDGQLIAFRRDGVVVVPAEFLDGGGVVKGLAGTITVLRDAGFTPTEMLRWLFTADESLPGAPIDALRRSRGREVKRRAQALAF